MQCHTMPCYFCSFSKILSKHNPCMVLWERQMHIFISQDLESCHYSKGNPKTVQLVTCLENTTNEQFRFIFKNSVELLYTYYEIIPRNNQLYLTNQRSKPSLLVYCNTWSIQNIADLFFWQKNILLHFSNSTCIYS